MLSEDVPRLMSMIPQEEHAYFQMNSQANNTGESSNTIFTEEKATPFEIDGVDGINAGLGEHEWIVERSRHEYDQVFAQLSTAKWKDYGSSSETRNGQIQIGKVFLLEISCFSRVCFSSQIMFWVVYGN